MSLQRILLALFLSASLAQAAQPAPHIGVQLWSVKDDLKQDFEGTLAKLAAMGFQGVEFAEGTQGKPIIGQDRTDWPAVYATARGEGGAEWIVVEQEEYPDGMRPLQAVAASLRGLQDVMSDSRNQPR
jgi:sugar phosphate isomerase/epimerase